MREKIFAIGDDFWIETEGGERAFKVDGKALRVRSTFILESPSDEELFKIQEKAVDPDRPGVRRGRRSDPVEDGLGGQVDARLAPPGGAVPVQNERSVVLVFVVEALPHRPGVAGRGGSHPEQAAGAPGVIQRST